MRVPGLPRDLRPMLASAGALPERPGWAYEIKWDGVRVLAAVEDGGVRLSSRVGNVVTGAYPELQGLAAGLDEPVLLDGEVVALTGGQPDFGALQSRMHVRNPTAELRRRVPVTLCVFDVLHAGSTPLLDEPYDERRARLEALSLEGAAWQTPPAFFADGAAVSAATRAAGMEGVLAKRRDSAYRPGRRSDAWIKVKHVRRQSTVVVGWQPGEGGRSGQLGSLLVALPGPAGLAFAGHVGTGFSAAGLRMLGDRLRPLRRDTPPLLDVPRAHARTAVWVEPSLVAEVEFTAWTADGRLRHPSFQGLRDDLDPALLVRE